MVIVFLKFLVLFCKIDLVLLDDEVQLFIMLCFGRVCKEVLDKMVSIGEKIGYWFVNMGLEGGFGIIGRFFGVCVCIIGFVLFRGGMYFSIRRQIEMIVKVDNVFILIC